MKESYIEDFEVWQKDFEFYSDIAVRFSETDLFGHLNNTVPFIYFEQARIDLLNKQPIMENAVSSEAKTIPVVADLQCDFLGQIYFGETVRVYVKYAKFGGSSVDIHYMGVVDGEVRLTGRSMLVQVDSKTGRSVKWTESQLEKIK